MRRVVTLLLLMCLSVAVLGCAATSRSAVVSSAGQKSGQQYQPWEKDPGAGLFVGSAKSNKYHYPSCEWAKKIKPRNEVWFSTAVEAQARGYVPCKVCKPPK